MWSKQAICAYVAREAFAMLKRGIRINAILPGPTDTPLARANAELWLGFGTDYRAEAGIEASTPEEQAGPLVFLCSDAARYVNGITMITDAGYVGSGITGSFPAATPVVDFLSAAPDDPGHSTRSACSSAARWSALSDGATFDNVNPATEQVIVSPPTRRTRTSTPRSPVPVAERA